MIKLTEEQKRMLLSKEISNAEFNVSGFTFDCLLGKWQVSTSEYIIGNYVFSRMSEMEFERTLKTIAITVESR